MVRREGPATGLKTRVLGCTDQSAELGIHRTQTGRRGSRLGRGERAEARCSTTTSSIGLATSATAPGRTAAGRCRRSRTTPCRPERRTHRHRPWPPQRPGRVSPRHRSRAPLRPGRGAPERASATALGRRCRPGRCRTGRRDGSPDCVTTAGPDTWRPDVSMGAVPGP